MKKAKLGCVYFFKHKNLSPIKIGYSDSESPQKRFESFKTYAPYGAEIIGFIITPQAEKLERLLHEKYKTKRLCGEWFDINIKDVDNEMLIHNYDYNYKKRIDFELSLSIELNEKSIDIPEEVFLFMDNFENFNVKIIKKDLLKEFIKSYPKYKEITSNKFGSWIKSWCILNNYDFHNKKTSSQRYFVIS